MEQYTITGMSCAACQTRVEKAVSKVPGVISCSVSLLTNSMGVEGTASSSEIIEAVQAAGYGASVKGVEKADGSGNSTLYDESALEDHETPVLKKRLVSSIGFLLVLMYFYRSLRPKPITDRMVKIVNSRLRLMPSRWSNTYFMLSQ